MHVIEGLFNSPIATRTQPVRCQQALGRCRSGPDRSWGDSPCAAGWSSGWGSSLALMFEGEALRASGSILWSLPRLRLNEEEKWKACGTPLCLAKRSGPTRFPRTEIAEISNFHAATRYCSEGRNPRCQFLVSPFCPSHLAQCLARAPRPRRGNPD